MMISSNINSAISSAPNQEQILSEARRDQVSYQPQVSSSPSSSDYSTDKPIANRMVTHAITVEEIKELQTELLNASETNDLEQVRSILERGISPDIECPKGMTPLMWSAHLKNIELTTLLLNFGADPNYTNSFNLSALQRSLEKKCPEISTLLLKNKADPNSGPTLLTAILNEDMGIFNLLLESGADVNSPIQNKHGTLLSSAFDNTEIRDILISNGFNINQTDSRKSTTLHNRAMLGSVEDLDWLVKNGASIDVVNGSGLTPLGMAAAKANVATTKFLLNQGANPNLGTLQNRPIVRALNKGLREGEPSLGEFTEEAREQCLQIAKLLLVAGADKENIDRDSIQKLFEKLKISTEAPLTLHAQSLNHLYKVMRTKPEESCDKLGLPSKLSNIIKDCNSDEYWHS